MVFSKSYCVRRNLARKSSTHSDWDTPPRRAINRGGLGLKLKQLSVNFGIGTTSPTYQFQLSTDAAAKPTTNTWTIASDARVKKEIADFKDGLDVVMRLKPRTYQYNGLGGAGYDDTGTHIGFVAQELEPVASYMVETRKGPIAGKAVDDFKSYQGHALPFILVNAIQEQHSQIEVLKQKIAQLEARK